ncbi:MAG: PEP-CTERM sorting domain-containing protein [Phycisphaeraceae bacterium]|nr:PEP-CTERM sorting domain-containing protein [Phycisphaeraceae bacterium]
MKTYTMMAATGLVIGATAASAAITGVSGSATWLGVAPANCSPGFLTGPTVYTWDEQQNVPTGGVFVDMVNNPGTSAGAISGVIGGVFDSHFLHLEDYSGVGPFNGSVTFSGQIIGVIFVNTTLDSTDASFGAGGTVYPTGYPFRGLNSQSSFSISGNTLNFSLFALSPVPEVVQIRVLTHPVPAPGGIAALGLGGLFLSRRRR